MKKTILSALICSSFFIVNSTSSFGADQQNDTSKDIAAIQKTVVLQQQKISDIQSSNEKLLSALEKQGADYKAESKERFEQLSELKTALEDVNTKLDDTNQSITTLENTTKASEQNLKKDVDSLSADTAEKTSNLDNKFTNHSLLGLLGLLCLLGILGGVYWYLRKQHNQENVGLVNKVQSALEGVKKAEENIVQSDAQLITQLHEVLAQVKLEHAHLAETAALTASTHLVSDSEDNIDHGLAIKLADEIHRMRRRIAALPENTKGLKSLSKSLERLEEELEGNGYEIIDYMGMNYTEGMTVKARFIPSDELDEDESIITRVVYPQVNFNDKLIQQADVEVSVG